MYSSARAYAIQEKVFLVAKGMQRKYPVNFKKMPHGSEFDFYKYKEKFDLRYQNLQRLEKNDSLANDERDAIRNQLHYVVVSSAVLRMAAKEAQAAAPLG